MILAFVFSKRFFESLFLSGLFLHIMEENKKEGRVK
jgi:hypothetical protein